MGGFIYETNKIKSIEPDELIKEFVIKVEEIIATYK